MAPKECPGYNTKQSDGEAPVIMGLLRNAEYPFIDMYEEALALNNLQRLICHENQTKPNQSER